MPKAVRVDIDAVMLQEALGIQDSEIAVYHAQIDNGIYGRPILQLYLTGEGLPDTFTVSEGSPVKSGQIILYHHIVKSEIREV